MAQRYQNGHLRIAKRKRGPNVWEFLWRERRPDGIRRQRTFTVGNVQKLPTYREAMNQLHTLKMNINKEIDVSPVLTFQALTDHYCQTELLAENKTPKTRKTYLVYLRNWILPKWGAQYLHLIKPVTGTMASVSRRLERWKQGEDQKHYVGSFFSRNSV